MIDNNKFIQSLADILQIKIIKPNNIETTSLGVAYLAGINSGLIKDTNTISKLWKIKKVFKPKIKKTIAKKQLKKWKAILNLLIKYHSLYD